MSAVNGSGTGKPMNTRQESLEYVDDSLQTLGRLVRALQVAASIDKDFNDTIQERRGVRALAYAVGVPFLSFIVFLALAVNRTSHSLLSLLLFIALIAAGLMGLGVYSTYLALWNHSKLRSIERLEVKRAYAVYKPRKDQLDAEIATILESDLIAHSRVPKEYLSIQHLRHIERYLAANQAGSLEEAIYDFQLDNLAQTRHCHGAPARDGHSPLPANVTFPQPTPSLTASGSSVTASSVTTSSTTTSSVTAVADKEQDPGVIARARQVMATDLHYVSAFEARHGIQAHQPASAQTTRALQAADRQATPPSWEAR